jgi:hypothetical protein
MNPEHGSLCWSGCWDLSRGCVWILRLSSHRLKTSSQKQKPLVDLTPVYAEPPQHSRKGKGRGVKVQPGWGVASAAGRRHEVAGGMAIPPGV